MLRPFDKVRTGRIVGTAIVIKCLWTSPPPSCQPAISRMKSAARIPAVRAAKSRSYLPASNYVEDIEANGDAGLEGQAHLGGCLGHRTRRNMPSRAVMRWRSESVRLEKMLRSLPVVYVRYFRDEGVVVLVGGICGV